MARENERSKERAQLGNGELLEGAKIKITHAFSGRLDVSKYVLFISDEQFAAISNDAETMGSCEVIRADR